MRTRTLFYALLSMAIVGAATSCKKVEEPIELPKPEVTIVKNNVADAAANFVSYTITTKNAVEAYWYMGEAIAGPNSVVEHGTKFTTESVVVEEVLPWNNSMCLWAVAISEDGQMVIDSVAITIGEEPGPEMILVEEYGVRAAYYSRFKYYDFIFVFDDGTDYRQLSLMLWMNEETNGVLPEGHYQFGEDSLPNIGKDSKVTTVSGESISTLVSATLDVEHIGNEYHLILNVKGADGAVYKVDRTGKVDSISTEDPCYNPGEALGCEIVVSGAVGECYERGYFLISFDYSIGTKSYMLAIVLVNDTDELIVPEDTYTYFPHYDPTQVPYVRGDFSFNYANGAEFSQKRLVDATVVVEHIDKQYHFDIYAVDESGMVVEIDWTGRLEKNCPEFPVYNPGDTPEPKHEIVVGRVTGECYDSGYFAIGFEYTIGIEHYYLSLILVGNTSGLVVPEGLYTFSPTYDTTKMPFIRGDASILTGENTRSYLKDGIVQVGHMGNQYHFLVYVVDEYDTIVEFDWTGQLEELRPEYPVYNPGEAPTE